MTLARFDSLTSSNDTDEVGSPLFASTRPQSTAASSPILDSCPSFNERRDDLDIWFDRPAREPCQFDCPYFHDLNQSQVSILSVSSSVLSFYRLPAPPSSPFHSIDANLHLTKKIDLPYNIGALQNPAFWESQWQDVEEAGDERDRLYSLMTPLERCTDSGASQPTQLPSAADETLKFIVHHREVVSKPAVAPASSKARKALTRPLKLVRLLRLALPTRRKRTTLVAA